MAKNQGTFSIFLVKNQGCFKAFLVKKHGCKLDRGSSIFNLWNWISDEETETRVVKKISEAFEYILKIKTKESRPLDVCKGDEESAHLDNIVLI